MLIITLISENSIISSDCYEKKRDGLKTVSVVLAEQKGVFFKTIN